MWEKFENTRICKSTKDRQHRICKSMKDRQHRICNSVLSVLHRFTNSVLTVLHRFTNSVLSVLHRFTNSVLSVLHRFTNSVLSVLHRFTNSVLSVEFVNRWRADNTMVKIKMINGNQWSKKNNNTTQKTKNWATRALLKTGMNAGAPEGLALTAPIVSSVRVFCRKSENCIHCEYSQ
jgi:hypothetical protein